jgi:hypothetical protein
MVLSLGLCQESGECSKSCVPVSACFCSQNGEGASIHLRT